MAKLYPPVLENIIPACYEENGMVKITVPFSMNRSVSATQVSGFELKIKTIQTGSHLYTVQAVAAGQYTITESQSYVTFYLEDTDKKLKIGQFYKIQLAYIEEIKDADSGNSELIVGYYSTTATIKYTTKPNVYINNFQVGVVNNYTNEYTGYYSQINGDTTEKIYSYCFNIYNNNKELILTSGEQVHNSSNDTNADLAFDKYTVMFDLAYNTIYYIQYTITTINNVVISTPLYKMMQRETIDPEIWTNINAILNFDNAYIDITLTPKDKNRFDYCTGSFVLTRSDSDSNYTHWEELHRFKFYETIPNGLLFRDFTIKQGKNYLYSIQQYNDYGLYSKRLYSNQIVADFEDAFLYDGEKQLKIRYNPKVAKFSNTVLESKQDTIGSKYPFIFRNGQVNYYEFSIAGLISYWADEEHLFVPQQELVFDGVSTDYITENIAQERLFKIKVLEWLNNGKPKLFKSPEEGNFLVRLMKVSLSPQDKLGRLLHSFNCSACEIAACTSENLQKYNILTVKNDDLQVFQQKTIKLTNCAAGESIKLNLPSRAVLQSISFEDLIEGDIVEVSYSNGTKESLVIGPTGNLQFNNVQLNIESIMVAPRYFVDLGATEKDITDNPGKYYLLTADGYVVADMFYAGLPYFIISNSPLQGQITCGYMQKRDNSFSRIKNVTFRNPVMRQFIGEHDILQEIQYLNKDTKNPKIELTEFLYIKVTKRPVDRIIAESIDEETLEDGNEFYYGADASSGENRSERFPLIELMYPIGLRPYQPETYYVQNSDGNYVLQNDPKQTYNLGTTYYLKGRYEKTIYPVGLVGYNPNTYYTKYTNPLTGEVKYNLATGEWQEGVEYYSQSRNLKGKISYHLVEYMTHDRSYVFEENKFYRKTSKNIDGKIIYTLARKFNPDFYYNKQYYYLNDEYDEYVNAYVTIDKNYVYNPYEYYIHVINPATDKDEYQMSQALEYNINEVTMLEGDDAEYEGDVLKYYKVKTILPHILHEVGINWQESKGNKIGYGADTLYHFQPKKYKDFYNNKNYQLNEYAPYIVLNGEKIDVNDTLSLTLNDLKTANNIYELKSGNGVVVEAIYGLKDYEYNIEENSSCRKSYDEALVALDTALEDLSTKNIDISDVTSSTYDFYYHQTPYNTAIAAYESLAMEIADYYKVTQGGTDNVE